ncbi:hypothetical protein LQ356_01170 [Metamycoplasma faucium]|uniref:Uncharacterized protein n=1 Tax=Metamycoplasma faucium TaxID=56142 RepID=A0ABZ2TRC2_9BACT
MKFKKIILNLESEIDLKTWSSLNKSHNYYNDIKFYLLHDEENPKIKYVIYMFNEDSKIIKDKKDKAMKQSEFQQTVLMAIDKINIKIDKMDTEFQDFKNYVIKNFNKQEKFNEEQRKFNEEQKNFNESFSNRIDSIEKRLTKLESFHKDEL